MKVSVGGATRSCADADAVDAAGELDPVERRGRREDARGRGGVVLFADVAAISTDLDVSGPKGPARRSAAVRRRGDAVEAGRQKWRPCAEENPEDVTSGSL